MWNESEWFKGLYTSRAAEQGPPYSTVWKLPSDFPLLDGHFPGSPIFPAVAIVDATLHFLKGVTKNPNACIQTLASAKFLSPITPEFSVRLELTPKGESEWQADWKEASTEKMLATLRIQLKT